MRVLFTTQPGTGHWRPLAPLAAELLAAGHEAAFAASPGFCADIGRFGFRCFPLGVDDYRAEFARQQAGLAPPVPPSSVSVMADVFLPRSARNLPELLAACRAWRPDVVVREPTEYAGALAAELLEVPCAVLQISAYRPHLNRALAAPMARLRGEMGLPPDPALAMLTGALLLLPFPPSLLEPGVGMPPTARFVRHVPFDLERPGETALPDWLDVLTFRKPVVYVSLGTSYNYTPGVFEAVLAGLGGEPVTLIVTTGGRDPAAFGPRPSHVHLLRYLPQSLVFPRCDLVVTHGGSGTVRTVLAHGLPLVVVPIAADQPDNARRCAALGVARTVAPDERTPGAVRSAVRDVLADPSYRDNARRLRAEFAALPGLESAVALLDALAAGKALPG